MYWDKRYVIDEGGCLIWHEQFMLRDEQLRYNYLNDLFIQQAVELYAVLGIQIGAA